MAKKLTKEDFIKKAMEKHGELYDYSLVEYTNYITPVTIICPVHGEFKQTPNNHLVSGCYECSRKAVGQKNSGSKEQFVINACAVHGDRYDYSLVKYENSKTQITIICKKHGAFLQKPKDHVVRGFGCPKCGGKLKISIGEFIDKARAVHGDKYDYSQSIYTNNKTLINIGCREHGEFKQLPANHLAGKGCPICIGRVSFDTESFIKEAKIVHGDKYDYSLVDYKTSLVKVSIICKDHGVWGQTPANHLTGYGCPKCVSKISKPEIELFDFVNSMFPDAYQSDRTIIYPKELDIVIPSKCIAIEYNGLHYHSDRLEGKADAYHLDKLKACESAGYRLIHIWEDDWRDKRCIVKNNLLSIFGKNDNEKIFARKCLMSEVDGSGYEIQDFLNASHIQGWSKNKYAYALTYFGDIVAVMTFSNYRTNTGDMPDQSFELVRYATSVTVVGGASKLLKAFLKDHPECKMIVSYSNNEMYNGNMYEAIGFKKERVGKPDYKVVINGKRRHKSGFKLENLKKRLGDKFDPNLTERENCRNNGLYRVYDCGLTKWVWTP